MRINATDISQGDYKCYLCVMDAKTIFEHSIVSRAKDNDDNGYQRHLDERRAKDISHYLDSGNVIPGCIILSAQKSAELVYKNNEITFKETKDAFFVIDGQHRLYGSNMADTAVSLPIYIFSNLKIEEEVQIFLDVNSKQKGVPKTLRIALTKFLAEPNTIDDIRLKLFQKLNEETTSPLFNRLTGTSSVVGKLSHVPFQEAINPILDKNPMKVLDFDKKYTLLVNLLTAVSDILIEKTGDSKKLSTTVLFRAIFNNFELICDFALMAGGYKYDIFKKVLQPIENIDFDDIKGAGTGITKEMSDNIKELLESYNTSLNNVNDLF